GACGLINLGNTCYANSGIQCLSYLPLLRSYLLSGQFKGDLNRDNPLGTGGKLLEEFAELMQVMWSGKYGVRAPQKFRSFLGKCRPQYSGADQQDAQELINDMIDMLHEDGNRVKKKPYVEALEDKFIEKTDLPRVGQEAWRRFLRRNRSAVSDLSMGQVYNSVTCPVCNHSSKNFDPFNMLSLPFPTVAEVIFQCTVVRRATEQRLDAVDCWRCPVCKVDREGKQSMALWNLPDLLTFHLKRFNASSRWREKISTKVDFPLTGLNMREWCDKESPLLEEETTPTGWRLGRNKEKDSSSTAASKGVAKSAEPLWLQFDDDLVEPLPPRNVVSETAYVLFYRR
ncbi:predicted protein, partial [Thalassiosira pseudonana CCMP1335]